MLIINDFIVEAKLVRRAKPHPMFKRAIIDRRVVL